MARSKVDSSPSGSYNAMIHKVNKNSKNSKFKNSPGGSITSQRNKAPTIQQPRRSLYNNNEDSDTDLEAETLKLVEDKETSKEYLDKFKNCVNRDQPNGLITEQKSVLSTSEGAEKAEDNFVPDKVLSIVRQGNFDDAIPSNVHSGHDLQIRALMEDDGDFPANLKVMLNNMIRTQIFRRIKFLTNEKLSLESSIFKRLFATTGCNSKHEQQSKYEAMRSLVQRQMNSKRNYCTDQILAKAKGTIVLIFLLNHFL
jgi:hypothetical protein